MIPANAGMPMRKRRCPRCQHVQTVALTLIHHAVTCRRCGSLIPAPKTPTTSKEKSSKR